VTTATLTLTLTLTIMMSRCVYVGTAVFGQVGAQ
jgi:hypothetical protein